MPQENLTVNQQPQQEGGQQGPEPKVHFENVEEYKRVVDSYQQEMQQLVASGYMTQGSGERLLNEFIYTAFNQMVQVQYK